jgi:hypothetical protein
MAYEKGKYYISQSVCSSGVGCRRINEIFECQRTHIDIISYNTRIGDIKPGSSAAKEDWREATAEEVEWHLSDPQNNIIISNIIINNTVNNLFPIY